MGAAGRRNSAGRSGLRCSEGVGASLEAARAGPRLDRHTGQSRQGHLGRRERVADALFKADKAPVAIARRCGDRRARP